jgi:purine-binding chemotaxis protein CheW
VSVGFLLVRAERRAYGLPLERVVEVADLTDVHDVPRSQAAVRGVTLLRGRLVPLVHLGALLGGAERPPPPERGRAVVVVQLGGRQVALEVDDAEEVVRTTPLRLPDGESLPSATGVAARGDALVPILDLDALGDRIG